MLSRPHLRIAKARGRLDGRGSRRARTGRSWTGAASRSRRRCPTAASSCSAATPASSGCVSERGAGGHRRRRRRTPFGPVATLSPALALTAVAGCGGWRATDASLLFVGETGVGKEVYARAVHAASGRTGAFVAINCAALPAELVESELFGYARGAHSTATRGQAGAGRAGGQAGRCCSTRSATCRRACRRSCSASCRTGRCCRSGRRARAGSTCASWRRPARCRRRVRADLVGRLGAEPIVIPPLRDRVEDIGALVAHFGGGARVRGDGAGGVPRAVPVRLAAQRARAGRGGEARGRARGRQEDPRSTICRPACAASLETGPRVSASRKCRAAPSRGELERLLRENRGNVAAVAKALDRQWTVVQRWLRQSRAGRGAVPWLSEAAPWATSEGRRDADDESWTDVGGGPARPGRGGADPARDGAGRALRDRADHRARRLGRGRARARSRPAAGGGDQDRARGAGGPARVGGRGWRAR